MGLSERAAFFFAILLGFGNLAGLNVFNQKAESSFPNPAFLFPLFLTYLLKHIFHASLRWLFRRR